MPTLLERAGDFSQPRRLRPAGADRRSRDRPAVSRQRDPGRIASARRRRRCSATIRCRTSMARRSTIRRRSSDDASGQRPDAPHAPVPQQTQAVPGTFSISGRRSTRRTVRLRRHHAATESRRDVQLVAPLLAVPVPAVALSVHAPDQRRDAVFLGRHQRLGGRRHRRQQPGPGELGAAGADFSSGIAGSATAQYAANTNQTHGASTELFWIRGRHNITIGGDLRRQAIDVLSQQDPRGTFGFTGAATGSDLADFLLGLPQTSSIAFGNADKLLPQQRLCGLRHRRLAREPVAHAEPACAGSTSRRSPRARAGS